MMTQNKRPLSILISLGILGLATQLQLLSMDASNSARIVSNGARINGLGMNGLGMNGEAANQFSDSHPGWIDPATTQATLNNQTAEMIGSKDGQLVFRVSK